MLLKGLSGPLVGSRDFTRDKTMDVILMYVPFGENITSSVEL